MLFTMLGARLNTALLDIRTRLHFLPKTAPVALKTISGERHTLSELSNITSQISAALEVDDILKIAIHYVIQVSGMESVVVYYSDHPSRPLRCIGQKIVEGVPLHPARLLYTETSIAGLCFREKRLLITTDAENDPQFGARLLAIGARSAISIPLISRGHAVGVLQITSHQARLAAPLMLTLLEGVAQQLAIALDNNALRMTEQKRRARAEMLQQVSLVLIATMDPIEAIEIAFQLLAEVLPFDSANVAFVENARYRVSRRISPVRPPFVSAKTLPIAHEVLNSWMPLLISDTTQHPLWQATAPMHPAIRCYMGAPLFRRDQAFGVLNVMSAIPYSYNEDDVNVIQTLANQFADAIEKAQLFRRMAERERIADDLILMGVTLSSTLEESKLLNMICEQSAPIFGVQGVYLWMVKGDQIVGAASCGATDLPFSDYKRSLTSSDSIGARLVRERKPVHINHARQSKDISASFLADTKARSVLGVPLLRGDHVLGALILVDTEDDEHFDSTDLEQLRLLGVQAALAIENARLFAETRHRLDQLRLVNEVGRVATSILTLGPLMEGIARPLFDEFNYHAISLLLVENEALHLHSLLIRNTKTTLSESQQPLIVSGAASGALRTSEPEICHDQPTLSMQVQATPNEPKGWYELSVPLIIAEEVIGVLNVERRDPITTDELDVLEPLSAQIAITVSNVRLFEMVRQQMIELDSRILDATLQLRVEKEHTEAVLQSVADAVIMTDLTGQMITTNPVATKILASAAHGGSENNILKERIRELVNDLIDGDKDTQIATIEHGSLALQAKAAKVFESGQDVGAVIVLRDITHLQEIDRLKTKFVSTVSHELRTPLANIKLYLQLLQTGRPEKRASYQGIMEGEVNRLERLITDVLDLSRLEQKGPRRRELLNMDLLMRSCIEANMLQAESKQLRLVYTPAPNAALAMVTGDRDQLAQVLMNLVGNAIRYTPDGGLISVSSAVNDKWLTISVQDNGVGINVDELQHIFDRFYRGTNVRNGVVPGTGLGLAICKEIVALHGGTIRAESELGKSSVFSFTLPLTLSL